MSRQRSPRGQSTSLAAYGAGDTRADLIPFPAGSVIPADHPLESFDVPHSLFDVARFIATLFFICAGGTSFFAVLFILFFVEFH